MNKTQKEILKILKETKEDLTISEIAKQLGKERHTASKHLEILENQGLVQKRNIGKSKLYKLSESPILELLKNENIGTELKEILEEIGTHISVQKKDMGIIWDNKNTVQGKKCYEEYQGEKQICDGCPVETTFQTGQSTKIRFRDKDITTKPIKNSKGETIAVVEIMKDDE